MTISRRTLQRQNAIRYESSRIKKARVAAGHVVNGTDAASTSTATTRPPTKRGRKWKVVPYAKRIRLEKDEREREAAAVSAARTAARAKLRGNSLAEQVSVSDDPVSDDIAKIRTGRKMSSNLNPRRGTRLNPTKPARGVKPIAKKCGRASFVFQENF